jgi:type IV secretion system protein VirB6
MLNGMLDNLSVIGGEALDSLLRPMAQSFGELIFYAMISDFIRSEIDNFGFRLLENVSSLVGVAALSVVTIWILFQGFRIISGQSRDSMMAFVLSVARVSLIVAAATSFGVTSGDLHGFITEDLPAVITSTVTGNQDDTPEQQIDGNLAAMQFAMTSIDAINVVQDPTLDSDKKRALLMVGIGTAGPAMIGGAMLLLYKVALALFVGLGPLFILCLIFDQTKSLFNRWLMYGISTMFSLAVLSAMLAIATKLVLGVAASFWALSAVTALAQLSPFALKDGMTTLALQQGGVGLLLTVLLVTTPPMAAQFFNSAIGQAATFSAFSHSAAGHRVSQAQPPQSQGRLGANPGEAGYQPPVSQGYSSSQVGNGAPSQAPPSSYNNPATNPNYGVTPPAPSQGLRGMANPSNPNQGGVQVTQPQAPLASNTSPQTPTRDRGDA